MKFEKIISKISGIGGNIYENAEIINQFKTSSSSKLPIELYEKEFLYTFQKYSTIIVIGETGCGKTTKIPEMLLRANDNIKIAHILPRKIAAITIAAHVAKNMNFTLGKEIGYSIRFDYNYNKETKVKFITEGMFIREMMLWPMLNMYNTIIIDDCHEKSINTEIILALLKLIQRKRKDSLKIIISSATIDYKDYITFFKDNVGVLYIPGRNYPVDIYYLSFPCDNYIKACFNTAISIHKNNSILMGDILIFLPGIEEINLLSSYFETLPSNEMNNIMLFQLSASMPTIKTLDVFKHCSSNKRRIIMSTNIAESSITIDNISFVIDSCFTKLKFYNTLTDADHQLIIPTSKSALNQRAGRAGRTRPGKCYRMITQETYNKLSSYTIPEIQRSNLREFILKLKSFGVKQIGSLELISKYDIYIMGKSLESLLLMNIIDKDTNLTNEIGKYICEIPIDCRHATALIYSGHNKKFNCVSEVLAIISMMSVNNLFLQNIPPKYVMKAKQNKGMIEGDHLTYLSIFKIFKSIKNKKNRHSFCKELYLNYSAMKDVEKLYENLKNYLKKFHIIINRTLEQDGEDIIKCFMKGFILNIAHRQSDNSYQLLKGENNIKLYIHPTSVLYTILPEYIVFSDILITKNNYVTNASTIQKEWIEEVCSNLYENRIKERIIVNLDNAINQRDEQHLRRNHFRKVHSKKINIIDELHNNNDYSDFFRGEDIKEIKEINNKKDNNNSNIKDFDEDIEQIALLRRKRNKNKIQITK